MEIINEHDIIFKLMKKIIKEIINEHDIIFKLMKKIIK